MMMQGVGGNWTVDELGGSCFLFRGPWWEILGESERKGR
jgi:hypothetical protein